jgi:HlyD family secretion protein
MRRSTVILLVILLLVLIVVGYYTTDPEAGRQILVDLGLASPIERGYVTSGILEAQTVYLSSEVTGRVISMPAAEGQAVRGDAILAQIETTLLEAQRDSIIARLEAAQAGLEMVKNGPRAVDLAVAQAARDQALAIWGAALQALEDAQDSNPKKIRDERVALYQAQVDKTHAALLATEAVLRALRMKPSEAEISTVQAAVSAAEAQLAGLEDQIGRGEIRSLEDGIVIDHLILPGELALPGMPIIAIADLSQLELVAYLPEEDVGQALVGGLVEIRVDAFPEQSFSGEVIVIADQAEYTPRNVQTPEERTILVYAVRILVENPDSLLKPGLPVDVVFGGRP